MIRAFLIVALLLLSTMGISPQLSEAPYCSVLSLELSRRILYSGQVGSVYVVVEGPREGSSLCVLKLKINGTLVAERLVELEARARSRVSLEFTAGPRGIYVVEVNGLQAYFVVIDLARTGTIVVLDFVVPESVTRGDAVVAKVLVVNADDAPGVTDLVLFVDGVPLEIRRVRLPGGYFGSEVFVVRGLGPGDHVLEIDGLKRVVRVVERTRPSSEEAFDVGALVGQALLAALLLGLIVAQRRVSKMETVPRVALR
ncbi:MAG: hypothetical protein QXU52_02350 [Fervidicoccaceae archaeon]